MADFFIQLTVIVLSATVLSLIAKLFRQPLILAYVATGILLGPFGLNFLQESASLSLFSQIGVALLLFIVGISLNTKHIKEIGKVSLITGLGQVIFTSFFGYIISILLGFNNVESIYISVALTFSSTIIIVKLLTDKGDLDSLYGRIAVGFLLIQDFIAIIALMLISDLNSNGGIFSILFAPIIKGLILIIGIYLCYKLIVKHLIKYIAKGNEVLLISSIAWCFGVAVIAIKFGFSLEIGAFLAGLMLANSDFGADISSKIRSLRDFFIAIFFINLGLVMVFDSVKQHIYSIIVFSLFILIGNPIIVFVLMILLGYRSRTSFLAGLTVAQISEFSLILMSLGFKVGYLSKDAVIIVTTVGIITITASTYLIMYGNNIFNAFAKYLHPFERKKLIENLEHRNLSKKYDLILFGCHRMGFSILNKIKKQKILVVDFDPEVIKKLKKGGIEAVYADANDNEIVNELAFLKPNFVISTIPNLENNKLILKSFRRFNPHAVIFSTCKHTNDCIELYKHGCDYVAYPEILAAQKITDYMEHLDKNKIRKWGKIYKKRMLEDLRDGSLVF